MNNNLQPTPHVQTAQHVPAEIIIEIPGIEKQPDNRKTSICKSSFWHMLKASALSTITATASAFIHQQINTQTTETPLEFMTQIESLEPTIIHSASFSGGLYAGSILIGILAGSSLTKYQKKLSDIFPELTEKRNTQSATTALVFLGICLGTTTVDNPFTKAAIVLTVASGIATTTDTFQKIPAPPQHINIQEIDAQILHAHAAT